MGPAIGQAGLNLMMFCKDFNARTAQFAPDTPLKCYVTAYTDKTYDMKILLPQARGRGPPWRRSSACQSMSRRHGGWM